MTNRKNDTASIFPNSGNSEADEAWATIVAQSDLELFVWGHDYRLMKRLHAITGNPEFNTAEMAYFVNVIRGSCGD